MESGSQVGDLVSLSGRIVVVTGATNGLGFEIARAMAAAGAIVVLSGRSEAKGGEAVSRIKAEHSAADLRFEPADLADLRSISRLAERLEKALPSIDVLINNAGVMAVPKRSVTADGFELQFGTNHLGHFALTAGVLPLLQCAEKPRLVTVSSLANATGTINFDDLQFTRNYRPYAAYSQSKLATLVFAREFQRRSMANGWGILSVAAHPGWSDTGLQTTGPRMGRDSPSWSERLTKLLSPFLAQSAERGALPILRAASDPGLDDFTYLGPDGWRELKGAPTVSRIVSPHAFDPEIGGRLWEVSEALTGKRINPAARPGAA